MDLLGSISKHSANGKDVLHVVDDDRQRAEAEHEIETDRPVRWRLESVCPWPDMPSLTAYTVDAPWHAAEATEPQLKYLATFGLGMDRELTKGEASHLIDRCLELDIEFPRPATAKQTWFLKRRDRWEEGLTVREASKRISEFKTQ